MVIHNALFLGIGFILSFLFCFPIGPASLEVINTALKKTVPQALRVSAGSAAGTALWATLAFYGGLFLLRLRDPHTHALLLLFMSLVCLVVGFIRILPKRPKEKSRSQKENKKQMFSGPFKGFALSISNPLPLVSWSVVSTILPKFQIAAPNGLIWTSSFFTAVWAGSFSYQSIAAWFSCKWRKKSTASQNSEKSKYITSLLFITFGIIFLIKAMIHFTKQ